MCEHRVSMYLCGLSWLLATRTTCSSGQLVEETQNRLVLVRAAVTKYHRRGDLKNRNLFSYISEGWESEIKVSAGLVSSETFLFDLHTAVFCLCPHVVFPRYCASLTPLCVSILRPLQEH